MDVDAIFCNECGLASVSSSQIGISFDPLRGAVPVSQKATPEFAATRPNRVSESPPAASQPPSLPDAVNSTNTRPKNTICPECGESATTGARFCSGCAYDLKSIPTKAPQDWAADGFPADLIKAVKKRYRDGYLYARAIVGAGVGIQTVGVIVGIIMVLIGIFVGGSVADQAGRSSPFGGPGAAIGVIVGLLFGSIGVIVGVIFFVIGIVVKASGQHLKAGLDSAVHSSPFLDNYARAEMMSLPRGGLPQKKNF